MGGQSFMGGNHGLSFSFRWIPEKSDNGRIFTSISYAFLPDFEAGVDFRPLVDEVSPNVNWRVLQERTRMPAVILGTSNDDFSSGNSQSVYASVSKHMGFYFGIGASPYAGATWIVDLEEVRPVGGLHLRYKALSSIFMYSGEDPHFTLSAGRGGFLLNIILFDLKLPGLGCGLRF